MTLRTAVIVGALGLVSTWGLPGTRTVLAQGGAAKTARQAYDELLDENVRDGMVFYRALKSEHAKLEGFVASLGNAAIDGVPRAEQIAFWLNAYNAFALDTVVEHYPIVERSREYPAKSVRQIPGAFERLPHRAAGRMVTLDQIEQTILPEFHDPRLYLALGRAAMGSGRLRSEAYTAEGLDRQLSEAAAECVNRSQCVQVDQQQDKTRVSSIFSWREKEFVAAYADAAPPSLAARSPIERAVVAFVNPRLLTSERAFLATGTFKMEYIPFDWSLNDLTGR